jgi:O-antigen/teichoic acid export membrane protein
MVLILENAARAGSSVFAPQAEAATMTRRWSQSAALSRHQVMGPLRKLATQSSSYLVGRVCVMALGFVSFPLFTRMLNVDQYGLLSLVATVVLSVNAFSKFGMQHALQRFYRERCQAEGGFRRHYSTLFWGALTGAALVAAIYVAAITLMARRLLSPPLAALLLIAAVLIVVRAVQSMVSNLLLVQGKTITLNVIEFVTKALTIATVCMFLLHWQRTARAYIVGMTAVEIAILAATLPFVFQQRLLALGEFDRVFWRDALVFALPMIWTEVGAVVLDTGDRFLVQHYLGPMALGYYAAAYGLAQYAWDLMVIPIGAVFFPVCMDTWVQKGVKETQKLLSNSLRYFLAPAIWLLCVVFLGSRDLIVILASKKYQAAHTLLPILVAGMVAAALPVFFRAGLLIKKKSGSIATITIVSIVFNVVLNIILLPRVGLQGAAIATFAAYALQAILMARHSVRLLPFEVPFRAAATYLTCAGVTALIGLQIRISNPWVELSARMVVAMLYPVLLWMVDQQLRTAVRNLLQRKPAATAAASGG